MNLTFHHFKKDVRQFRLLLAIWLGLLLIDFAVNAGWVGNVEYSPSSGFESGSDLWTALLPTVLWAFAVILPSLVVLADSPARNEGFLATRPIRKRDILAAKVIFILSLIVVPWTVAGVLYLAVEGLPVWVIVRGSQERLLFFLPVVFGFSAFATLWPSVARWTRALGIGFGCYLIFGILYSFCVQVLHMSWLSGGNGNISVAAPYILVLTLILFTIWHARQHRSWRFRWLGLFGCVLIGWLSSVFWKSESIRIRPENPAAAKATVTAADFRIPAPGIRLVRESDPDRLEEPRFNLSLLPEMKPSLNSQVIEWSGKGPHLIRPNDREIVGANRSAHAPVFQEYSWSQPIPFEEVAAWAKFFPSDAMFRHFEHGRVSYPAEMTFTGFRFPKDSAEFSEPLRLKAELEARVFEWRKIADLPLTPGATSTNDFGSWKIIATQSGKEIPFAELYLERQQIELFTAADSRCSSAFGGPLNRMKPMVYDPRDQIVWLMDSYSMSGATRAEHTGFVRHFVHLPLSGHLSFTADELSRLRLVILEKSWIGSVPQQWESPEFTLQSRMPKTFGVANNGNYQDTLSRGELNRRLAAFKIPGTDAPRREISLYLLEYFRLLDAYGESIDSGSPEVMTLASLVPTQLNLLLEGLPAMGWVSKSVVLAAIEAGALEEQKPLIIAAVRSQSELAEVLLKRGWNEDARSELYDVVRSESNDSFPVFQAVALFRDSQTYPWLLKAFERHPSVSADDVLHRLGLGEQAGEIIRQRWNRNRLIWRPGSPMFDEIFRLAMKHGDYSALQRAFLVLKQMNPHDEPQEFGLFDGFGETVQMPDLKPEDRHHGKAISDWMRKHQPEDFVFSPARRQFVLKPLTNSIAAAANATTNP